MKKIKIHIIVLLLTLGFLTNSCIESFDVQTLGFEDALVVEALITNEFKTHQIKLSNSFKFEEFTPPPETNAVIYIADDIGGRIDFTETFEAGVYSSDIPFAAEAGKEYQLFITTSDNKSYESKAVTLTNITQIDKVYAERDTNNLNEDGVSIFVDSYDATGNSRYYRYEYEETYKIVAPRWSPVDLVIVTGPPYEYPVSFDYVSKTTEQKTCYNTKFSNGIVITETTDLAEDKVEKFNVRFLKSINPVISHRYSILVKQYVQSIDAYTYYQTLKKLSSSQNGITQNQPGFIEGNIRSSTGSDEKVIGIFEVSSVSEKRMFFNYKDLFEGEALPPYFTLCEITTPSIEPDENVGPQLPGLLYGGEVKYYDLNGSYPEQDDVSIGPFNMVPTSCGDCTRLGTNVKPDFWYE
ncbi:DUF4249 domain-containing protein [Aureibaculum conchae]|uniref:DUF4249 domain-containing protein n=1 Tax=Aureibaculum sp. 2308TA14-22 TaxID=3108392 RepID=UPI003397AB72